jgi:hypothetical protein
MGKIILNKEEIITYMKTEWKLYASEVIDCKLNRFWFNDCGEYKITSGDDFTFTTKDIDEAVKIFNDL